MQAQAGGGVIIQGNAQGNVRININGGNVRVVGGNIGFAAGGANVAPGLDKPPLAPEAEKELADLLGKLKEAKRKVWEKRMEKEMDDMVQQTGMGEEERKALAEPAKQAIETCVGLWLEKMDSMFRKMLQRNPRVSTQLFGQYRQAVDAYAESDVVPGVKQPIDNAAWVEAWKKVLTPQHLDGWNKFVAKREAAAREELKDVLKPFEERFQTQFESDDRAPDGGDQRDAPASRGAARRRSMSWARKPSPRAWPCGKSASRRPSFRCPTSGAK